MIRSRSLEDKMRRQRADAKTLDNLFRRRIEAGANCAPFVSQAILQTAKEVFPLDPQQIVGQLGLGQVKLLVVAATEPAGKALDDCQKVTVCLTLDMSKEDFEVRCRRGVVGLRRARLLRLTCEDCEQGGLLSHEDLAYRLLNCSLRTIVRDIQVLRRAGVETPTRGQQQDIGPGQTHRAQAVRLFLQGFEPNEVAHRLYHTLASIETTSPPSPASSSSRVRVMATTRSLSSCNAPLPWSAPTGNSLLSSSANAPPKRASVRSANACSPQKTRTKLARKGGERHEQASSHTPAFL